MKTLKKGTRVYLDFMSDRDESYHYGVIESIDYNFHGMNVHLVSGLLESGFPFSCSSNNVSFANNQNSSLELAKYARFELWVSNQDEYQSLLSAHGERLFVRDSDTGYRIRTMRLAFKAWSAPTYEKNLP